jgi:hypothetical protein
MWAVALLGGLVLGQGSAMAQGAPLFAVLNGGNEVTAGGQANQGDLDAYGSATVVLVSDTQVCFGITVVGLDDIKTAHIHVGKAGTPGAIVVTLLPVQNPTLPGSPGHFSNCVAAAATRVRQIRAAPTNYYVNVHSTNFPNGGIRGNLF